MAEGHELERGGGPEPSRDRRRGPMASWQVSLPLLGRSVAHPMRIVSMAGRDGTGRARAASARTSVSGPSRPDEHRGDRAAPARAVGSSGVRPVEAPTVPNAETDSKTMAMKSSARRRGELQAQGDDEDEGDRAGAPPTGPVDDLVRDARPRASADGRPRTVETIAMSSTLKVLTLMPPAVEPDAPPMNIIAMTMNRVGSRSCGRREGAEAGRPKGRGLEQRVERPVPPRAGRPALPGWTTRRPRATRSRRPGSPASSRTTTRVSRASRRQRRLAAMSPTIAKPRPPSRIRTPSVPRTSGCVRRSPPGCGSRRTGRCRRC